MVNKGKKHLYHLVEASVWPIITAMNVFAMLLWVIMYMQEVEGSGVGAGLGLLGTLYSAMIWWRDVVREGTYEGQHTLVVQRGLKLGMVLFIVSEIMFFVAFFWAYFHSSLAPTIEIGSVWPPTGLEPFNPWEVPLLNTAILLISGASITWAHHALVSGKREESLKAIKVTVILAVTFTILQVYEYGQASFSIADGVYGSTFYLATGFHGLHVIIGTLFIAVCAGRLLNYHFTTTHHVGMEAAIWYWHFVDVVWLFLFVTIYWWGSL
jgi:cytochrome c oxidase subunit 3